jgi:hypothetical protein
LALKKETKNVIFVSFSGATRAAPLNAASRKRSSLHATYCVILATVHKIMYRIQWVGGIKKWRVSSINIGSAPKYIYLLRQYPETR